MATERLEIPVFPQDPQTTPTPERVQVAPGLLPGPVGKRVAVFDYNRDRDEVYAAARPRRDGTFPAYDPDDLRFHQLNAYAITARAVELTELELGRDLRWGFEASRLIVLPHAGYLANAFYSEQTHSLQLFSFRVPGRARARGDSLYHTALSHDIVAHETGHAILDSVRDRYTEALHPETSALHEAIGDLTALFAALSYDTVRRRVAPRLARPNLVSRIAEDFTGPRGPLRSLQGRPRADWSRETEPHLLSLKLTRAVYAALVALARLERRRGAAPLVALKTARRVLQRMVVRALDFLPPADATFGDFARAMLAADRLGHAVDERGYRAAVAATLHAHHLLQRRPDGRAGRGAAEPAQRAAAGWRGVPRSWPRPTAREAYLFLDANRGRLALGRYAAYRDFVVRDLQVSLSAKDAGSVGQVVLVYEYPVDVQLKGADFGPARGAWLTFWGGGTLVFDADGSLRHHAAKPVTAARVRQGLDFLRGRIAGGAAAPVAPTLDDQLRREQRAQPWTLLLAGDRAALRRNPAVRCVGPPHRGRPGGRP